MTATRVVQFTDTHLRTGVSPTLPPEDFADAAHALTGRSTNESAAAVTRAVRRETEASGSIDLVIHTGDMVDTPMDASYATAVELLGSFDAPVLACPGNHDSHQRMSAAIGASVAERSQVMDFTRWRIVLLRSAEQGRQSGRLDEATLDLFTEALDCELNVLVGMHHPPLSPCNHNDCVNEDATRFFDIVDRHDNVAAVISGHLHMADEIERHGVRYLLGPSTAFQVRHIHPLRDHNTEPTPAGARLIDLHDDGSIDTSIIWA